jgi:peptidoglycan/LPS O-acetylase OafA/YrhL
MPESFRALAVPFYIRRVFRIWPAAFLWLLIALLGARFVNESGAFGHFRADLRDTWRQSCMTPGIKINVGLIALASAGLVLMASCNLGIIVPGQGWLRAGLLWGGSRSFGIYLVHDSCFWLTREIFYRVDHGYRADHWVGMAVTCGILLVLTTEMSYRLVGTPLRELGQRLSKRAADRRLRIACRGVALAVS